MKTLSVRQPWASLICSGMKDVENRTWKPAQLPCRILIHASSAKLPKSWAQKAGPFLVGKLLNVAGFGWIPLPKELPTSAIIGYVDVVGVTTESESMWADEGCQQWQLAHAHVFDEPIRDVKGKLNLFEFPLDENNLPPAHQVNRILPCMEGDTFVITLTDAAMEEQWNGYQEFQEGDDMLFYSSDEMDVLVLEDESCRPVKAIRVQNESQTKWIHFEVTENGFWLENEGTEDEQYSFVFRLGKKLN